MCVSFLNFHARSYHMKHWKWATVVVFTPQKLANALSHRFWRGLGALWGSQRAWRRENSNMDEVLFVLWLGASIQPPRLNHCALVPKLIWERGLITGLSPINPRLAREGLLWEVVLGLPEGEGLPEGDPMLRVLPLEGHQAPARLLRNREKWAGCWCQASWPCPGWLCNFGHTRNLF